MENVNPSGKILAQFVRGGYGDVMHLSDPNNFTYVRNGLDGGGERQGQKWKCTKKKSLKCPARAVTVTDQETGIIWIQFLSGGHTHEPSLRDQVIYILINTLFFLYTNKVYKNIEFNIMR